MIFERLKGEMHEYSGLLETHDRLMRALGAPMGILLATIWIVRLPIDIPFQIVLAGICAIATIFACARSFVKITFTRGEGQDVFVYIRRGVSWGFLVSGMIGATIVFAAIRFLNENGLADSPAVRTAVTVLALFVTVLIVPVTPLLANIPKVSSLKTLLEVVIDSKKQLVIRSRLHVCPADSMVPDRAEQAEILRRLDAASSVFHYGDELPGNV